MLKNILFDLDGTLLPMDMEHFTNGYFKLLVKKLQEYGFEGNEFIKNIWTGIKYMVANDGTKSNAEAFWNYMETAYGERVKLARNVCEDFYANEFDGGKEFCGFNPDVKKLVDDCRKNGYRVFLATNPIFPDVATRKRTSWAGLDVEDFEWYTTYENCNSCKPNLNYYMELINRFSLNPEECLMVGNDVEEDMVAEKLGMQTFLITDCMINKNNRDISVYDHGNFDDLRTYIGI